MSRKCPTLRVTKSLSTVFGVPPCEDARRRGSISRICTATRGPVFDASGHNKNLAGGFDLATRCRAYLEHKKKSSSCFYTHPLRGGVRLKSIVGSYSHSFEYPSVGKLALLDCISGFGRARMSVPG